MNIKRVSILFLLFGLISALIVSNYGLIGAGLLLVVVVGIPAVYFIVAYPKFGVIVLLVMAYLIMWFIRFDLVDYPLGTVMDLIQFLLIIGFFIAQKYRPDWSFIKDPIGIMMLIWIGYNLLQFVNPTAESRLAWLYTIRSVAVVMLMYFVFCYHIRDVKFIRLIFKIWLGLALFAALYAFKQEYFGFFGFEETYLYSAPKFRNLLFINGHWRKFSIFSDPVAFSYAMAVSSIFCITMLFGPVSMLKKVILGCMASFFLLTMLYSGTRGAYVLVPVAIVLFAILNFNRKVFTFAIFGGFLLALLIFLPTSNQSIRRFQTAFLSSDDASYNLRKDNQKRIQPYIQSHPFGGGLGSTGIWGVRFSPNSMLAKFPPDSGYVRVAVELGWIGLFIFCTLVFIILKTGIDYYYKMKDPELRTYCLAMILIIFAYAVGNYPQEAIIQFPSNIYIYLFAALINVTFKLDRRLLESQSHQGNVKISAK